MQKNTNQPSLSLPAWNVAAIVAPGSGPDPGPGATLNRGIAATFYASGYAVSRAAARARFVTRETAKRLRREHV